MRIPTSARIALIEAFSYFKRQPDSEIFERPTHEISRSSPRRIRRDRSEPFQPIVEVPGQLLTAVQTIRGRTSTTGRCGDLTMIIGPILAAAEGPLQTDFGRAWLRYAYDDDCPSSFKVAVHSMLMAAWGALDVRSREINPERMTEYGDLAMITMIDMRHRFATTHPIPWSNRDKCQMLGLRATEDDKNWNRSWRPHERDMQIILDEVDKEALIHVYAAIQDFAA